MKIPEPKEREYFPFYFTREGRIRGNAKIDKFNALVRAGKVNNNFYYYNYILGIIQGFINTEKNRFQDLTMREEDPLFGKKIIDKYIRYKNQLPEEAVAEIEDCLKNLSPNPPIFFEDELQAYYDYYCEGIEWYKNNIRH